MHSAWLVPLAMLFGLVVGAGLVAMVTLAMRRGSMAVELTSDQLPDGIDGVLGALPSAGLVVDPSNSVIRWSPGAASMGLVQQRALVHTVLGDIADECRRRGEPVVRDLALPRGPFGNSALLHVTVRAARLGVRYVLLLVDDRTEALRLDAVRRDFVANISHELKTPIGAVSLLAEALDTAADDPERVRRFADRLTTEAARLSRITREVIELSQLQSADVLRSPEVVDVDHVLAGAIDQNAVAAAAAGIELARGGVKHTEVLGDEALLTVAVHNVIANALQYSPQNSRIGIGVRKQDGLVEVSVTDQGIGIAEEDLERVFERFFRVDPARSRNTGGSGLGLSIVKHIVQNHGGEVRLWSQPGRGSTFTLRIPEATPDRAALLGLERS